jgi:hypothetical protein
MNDGLSEVRVASELGVDVEGIAVGRPGGEPRDVGRGEADWHD